MQGAREGTSENLHPPCLRRWVCCHFRRGRLWWLESAKDIQEPLEPNRARSVEPFTIIDQKRTAVIIACAKGQGIQTTFAALAAEQSNIILSEINVEREPSLQADYNSAMAVDRSYEAALEIKPSGWAAII